jgi:hypothetical protein
LLGRDGKKAIAENLKVTFYTNFSAKIFFDQFEYPVEAD